MACDELKILRKLKPTVQPIIYIAFQCRKLNTNNCFAEYQPVYRNVC